MSDSKKMVMYFTTIMASVAQQITAENSKLAQILRVQCAEGTWRVEAGAEDCTAALYERVHSALALSSFAFTLHKDRARREEVVSSKSRRLRDCGLQHGDMLYLSPVNGARLFDQLEGGAAVVAAGSSEARAPSPTSPAHEVTQNPIEDELDLELYKESGMIQRQRDEKLCRHNSNGRCVHCAPLEPWDEQYLREHNIKHMSFHSYLRKLQSTNFVSLNELSYKIKPGCTEHPPWPRGICSACQPGAVTLARQPYRHVDNVLVEHPAVVERFLAAWRASGAQRFGLLYGRHERHPGVPLGVRARVAAIYEPPQHGSRDEIRLLDDPARATLDALAARLGLCALGWVFTDLLPLDAARGTVRTVRCADTHFLSAQECLTAAHYQALHPRACRHAPSGTYGSRWVTVCATGDAAHGVALEGYQVSEQGVALARDGVLVPARDAPELACVRASSDAQYVPEVQYAQRDQYGNEVPVRCQQVPVAYLLVDVPCGVASPAAPSLWPDAAFPPCNRGAQSLAALAAHVAAAPDWLAAASDLHALLYLATNEALPLSLEQMAPLLAAVRAQDAAAAEAWRAEPHAATLLSLLAAAAELPAAPAHWTCRLCTFHNAPHRDSCEMCAMPRNAGEL